MLQRPQTLYFLATFAICAMLIFSKTTFYKAENVDTTEKYDVQYRSTEIIANDGQTSMYNIWILAFCSTIGILSVIALFMFKQRKLQLLLASFNYLFILGLIIMMYMYSIHMDYFSAQNAIKGYTFYALLPLALIIFNFLAARGVRKDEQLIRSMDRLR